ncbi:hypothetical protein DFP72DRAFT_1163450 [Ephemerocybe angulata]|uniref:F-box domain-containing protein n=1 Tax=Ephemerocybe angulata TaxID=980116 RepID=A0A8H6MDI1_9AGAR|nr:hypothetical protein DFP72DRAFT_1163450 [Tulosesus angulatus]
MDGNVLRGILALPLELYLYFLQELHPPDLLSLGQTCKLIRSIVSQRHVWEAALRATCRLNQVFEPSYEPIGELSLGELQRAALEPWRRSASFATWAIRGEGPTASSMQSVVSSVGGGADDDEREENEDVGASDSDSGSSSESGEQTASDASGDLALTKDTSRTEIKLEGEKCWDETGFEEVYVIPGGRYVLGRTEKYVCLWDVGQTGRASRNSDSRKLRHTSIMWNATGSVTWLMSAPRPVDVSSFRFATCEDDLCFRVFEVGPMPDRCEIREIGKFKGESPGLCPEHLWVQEDRMMCCFDEALLVWDFVKSEYNAIPIRGEVSEITTNGNMVVAWEGSNTGVWTIPRLKPLEVASSTLDELLPSEFTNRIDLTTIKDEDDHAPRRQIHLPSAWYSYPLHALEYATLHHVGGKAIVERYLLNIAGGAGAHRIKTLVSSSQLMDPLESPQCKKPYRTICGGLAIMIDRFVSPKRGWRAGFIQSVGDGALQRDAEKIECVFKELNVVFQDFSYCPVTGRAAYIPLDPPSRDVHKVSIMTLDY